MALISSISALLMHQTAGADLPEPLALEQALALAEDHPRASDLGGLAGLLPRREGLYLDCHGLAFPNAVADTARGAALTPLLTPCDAQRLEIIARFFDVLLADLAFSRFNEATAVAYVQFDRASSRRDLGQISDLRVMELESAYAEILQSRAGSEIAQQLTRSALASALNRPDRLPRDLVQPALPEIPAPLPEAAQALAAAIADNPEARRWMVEGGELDRRLLVLELRQQLIELTLRLRALDAAARQVTTESAYRDLKLDQSRTLYEQEVTADLGYSMSRQTMTRLREQRIEYCRALTWAEIAALMGRSDLGGLASRTE